MKKTYHKEGCIDKLNDLWGNVACELHIDPKTCGREKDCSKCERYTDKISDEIPVIHQALRQKWEKLKEFRELTESEEKEYKKSLIQPEGWFYI